MSLTLRGVLLLFTACPLLALGAWQPEIEWIGWLWALMMGIICLIDAWLAGSPGRFEITRHHEPRLSLGVDNVIKVQVRFATGTRPTYPTKFWIRDEPPQEFPASPPVLSGRLEFSPAGSPGWQSSYQIHPTQRGDFHFGDINIRWSSPLGLIVRQARQLAGKTVKVYPNLLEIRRYDLLLRRTRLQEIGLRHSRQFGSGTEYERLREYQADDDFRRIDWKSTARRRRPVTIEYETERSQMIMAVLDTGRLMQSLVNRTAKLDYAVNAVLFLGYVAASKGDQVGLLGFADQIDTYLSPEGGRAQFYRMLETLYAVRAQPVEPDYRRALSYLMLKQRRRALVIIFTDLTPGPGLAELVAQTALLRRTSLPLVVTISDPDIIRAAQETPIDSLHAYQRMAASQLLAERQVTLDQLRRQGVLTLDVPADQLSIAVINQYLELKARTSL